MSLKTKLTALSVILWVVIADQLSKWAVMEKLIAPRQSPPPETQGFWEWFCEAGKLDFTRIEVLPFFNWVMVWNRGVSFGMLQSGGPFGAYFMAGLALVISALFLIWMFKTDSKIVRFSIALVIGGALGNVIDRLRFGAVADFLDFHAGGWHWPAFNVADSCITLGIALIIIDGLFFERRKSGRDGNA